jgi:hypothetical protein
MTNKKKIIIGAVLVGFLWWLDRRIVEVIIAVLFVAFVALATIHSIMYPTLPNGTPLVRRRRRKW